VTSARLPCASGLAGCFVPLDDVGSDAPAVADRDAMLFGPGPDGPAAPADGRGARRAAVALPRRGPTGMIDERRELAAERGGVVAIQIDLIVGAGKAEPQGLVGRTAVEIIFQSDSGPGYRLGPMRAMALPAPYRPGRIDAVTQRRPPPEGALSSCATST
jgi:hypothetical protein